MTDSIATLLTALVRHQRRLPPRKPRCQICKIERPDRKVDGTVGSPKQRAILAELVRRLDVLTAKRAMLAA